MVIERGEIWWASLPEPAGSEPGYRRPVLIIQSNDFNRSRIATVIAVVITSNTKLAQAPGNVFLPHKLTGLPKDSVANISQVVTVDKAFLTAKVGRIPLPVFEQIEKGLRLVLQL
ncbi:MAG: type II toxin-antitoxin system PemK/MazF family toxin [Anaerolineae bacterium]|nr:type II toxin-antitoxin system PemK/MazF family toxin [Anaerolineae bacterium]MCB0227090.1 type II toxin-antitoxin system PemK/MazF family toxin [Anaerolineae bacterium]